MLLGQLDFDWKDFDLACPPECETESGPDHLDFDFVLDLTLDAELGQNHHHLQHSYPLP